MKISRKFKDLEKLEIFGEFVLENLRKRTSRKFWFSRKILSWRRNKFQEASLIPKAKDGKKKQ